MKFTVLPYGITPTEFSVYTEDFSGTKNEEFTCFPNNVHFEFSEIKFYNLYIYCALWHLQYVFAANFQT